MLNAEHFQSLLDALREMGFVTCGPRARQGAIAFAEIATVDALPIGFTDQQAPGSYRLTRGDRDTFFAYVVGAQTLRTYLQPATQVLCEAARNGPERTEHTAEGQKSHRAAPEARPFSVTVPESPLVKRALIGVRPCELQALAVYDTVFGQGSHVDASYLQKRRNTLIVAVNCTHPAATCFCTSMHTGPKASSGFDLALTEIVEAQRHFFLIEAGSSQGAELIDRLPVTEPTGEEIKAADEALRQAAQKITRSLDPKGIKELLYAKFDDPRWEETAARCLSCGNCTLVCPTCFCTTVEDRTDLAGDHAQRLGLWDSCHTLAYSYIHGGSVRPSVAARYRQWMTHKLGYWHDQFGTSGCVGCGRCITWCPAGIDITEEAAVLRAGAG